MHSKGLENAVLYCPCSLGVTRTARDSRMQSCIVHARLASHVQRGTRECSPVLSMLAWRHMHSKGLENTDLYCPCLPGVTRTARDLRTQTCIVHRNCHLAGINRYVTCSKMLKVDHVCSSATLICRSSLQGSKFKSGSCVFQCHTILSV